MWPLRIALARLRPFNGQNIARILIVAAVFAAFLFGDYLLFLRLFRAIVRIEEQTPLLAIGLVHSLLSLVFFVAIVILFSSSMTTAIGSFFTDLDLDLHHSAPRSRLRIATARWMKTLLQSATIVFLFLIPLVIAFLQVFPSAPWLWLGVLVNLVLLLTVPVSLACSVILMLVRWFPVRRVHQIVASLAVLVLTMVVIAFRVSRPERLFSTISTDDVRTILRAIEVPAMEIYPSSALAMMMTTPEASWMPPRIFVTALVLFALFLVLAHRWSFLAFVRARESMAPVAIGAASTNKLMDRLLLRADPPLRALLSKEVRTIGRDVAQWSQLFLMIALLFIYIYNIRMLPLGGDARAALVAYANVGMTGFVIAAICLRFAYPSISAEGKAFWLVRTSPVSYRNLLLVKVLVYAAPLTLLALLLTAVANFILAASVTIWLFTMIGAALLGITLVSLGVGLGAFAPDFNAENPLQVGLSLGGFAYMAVSLAYVLTMMLLMARPLTRYLMGRVLRAAPVISVGMPIAAALVISALVAIVPLIIAERRLSRLSV
jgi:ABC-2 type transport system permease protein